MGSIFKFLEPRAEERQKNLELKINELKNENYSENEFNIQKKRLTREFRSSEQIINILEKFWYGPVADIVKKVMPNINTTREYTNKEILLLIDNEIDYFIQNKEYFSLRKYLLTKFKYLLNINNK